MLLIFLALYNDILYVYTLTDPSVSDIIKKGLMEENNQQKKRRSEILESAKELFSTTGFHKADMNEIAKRANVAKGTVYLYYPSKKELFITVIKDGLENLSKKISDEVENNYDSVGKIKKAISTYMLFFADNQALYRILLHPDLALIEDVAKTMKDIKLSKLPQLADALKKGVEEKQIRKVDEKALSYMILGMIDFVLYQWLSNSGEEEPIEEKIEQIIDVLFRGILSEK